MDALQANDRYSGKLPSPPRVIVPPPIPNGTDIRLIPITTQYNSVFGGVTIPLDFLKPNWGSWDYNERRQAQPILPCLYLGPFAAAKDAEFLKANGFGCLVAVTHTRPGQDVAPPICVKVADDLGLRTHVAKTFSNQDLIAQFPAAIATLNSYFADQKANTGQVGRALICCSSGNELSAAVAVAYILETTSLSLVPAIQLAQFQRFCINLDDAMKHTLKSFEDIVLARRAVKGDPSEVPRFRQSIMCNLPPAENRASARRGSKRCLEEEPMDDDGDAMMNGHGENGDGADGARKFTPFSSG